MHEPTPRERLAGWLWALLLLGCAVLLTGQLWRDDPLDTRITALLPESRQAPLVEQAEKRLSAAFEDRFVLLVGGPQSAQRATELEQRLHRASVANTINDTEAATLDSTLGPYRYVLLPDTMAQANSQAWLARGLNRLFTPGAQVQPRIDPFGLLDAWLAQRLGGALRIVEGRPVVVDENRQWQLINAQLSASPYDMDLQRRLEATLDDFGEAYPEARLLRAGLVFHAAAGARQAKAEMTFIGVGSLLGVVVLLWFAFRRGRILASLLLPVACGLLFALPLTWLLFGTLNLLTLAFGASLIGVAIDYALHLQCARQLEPQHPLPRLWPGLWLGLISSLAAYLVQLFTPMPGLRQMATFAALGLLGAWLTVRLWLPHIVARPHSATGTIATQLNRLRLPARAPRRWAALSLLGIVAAILIITRLTPSNDLRQLNPSPATLIDEQQRVQQLLQRPSGMHYLLVTADTEATLLERLEALDEPLGQLRAQGHLAHFQHLAQSVPSPARQQRNLALVKERYDSTLPMLIERSGLPTQLERDARQTLKNAPLLSIDTWLKTPFGQADNLLWLGDKTAGSVAALVTLGDSDTLAQQTFARLAESVHIDYYDRTATLSATLASLRDQIALWLGIAIAALALLFGWRYRSQAWRVLLPPLGALLATLAIFSAAGIGLTLFHLLGLLLVLGIGLDAGIFSTEHPGSRAAWLAISLSCATSLLAFGLLAFSTTPALHQLGLTCLTGLAATWALVPFARAERHVMDHSKEHQIGN